MSRKTWKSERILTENGFVNGYITICDDKIEKITTEWDGEYEDLGKVDIFPGIIDVHNHGFGGWSMTDPCTDEDKSTCIYRYYRDSSNSKRRCF